MARHFENKQTFHGSYKPGLLLIAVSYFILLVLYILYQ